MEPKTDAPMEMREGAETFRDRVIHPWMFRAYMMAKMPVLGVTGTWLEEIDTRQCETVIPYGWGTKNLFGRMFDSAVLAAAETTSLALLVLHVRNQSADLTAELVSVDADIEPPPSEDLRIRAESGHRYADFVYRAAAESPRSAEFTTSVTTSRGVECYSVDFRWRLRRKS